MAVEPRASVENSRQPLLIVGASVRAAAMSANRAKIPFIAVDLFTDRDLCELPQSRGVARIGNLRELADIHWKVPMGPWMYTGGVENLPAIVRRISRHRELWGNSAAVLAKVRDPRRVQQTLTRAGFAFPEIRAEGQPRAPGRWLWKPHRSAGGRHIRFVEGKRRPTARDGYLQAWVPGVSVSAVFIASRQCCRLVGTSRQVLRRDLTNEGRFPFQYFGSVLGPSDSDPETPRVAREVWSRLGTTLWQSFHLTGIFGVDAVIRETADGATELVPIEINPRFTASVELFERAFAFSAVAKHVAACRNEDRPRRAWPEPSRWYGKSILYATRTVDITASFLARVRRMNDRAQGYPAVADIPHEGTRIRAGQPIATVLATAATRAALYRAIGWTGRGGLRRQLRAAL